VLWESNAIVRHLAASYPQAGLWPTEPRVRADADRWMDWQATTATPAMRDVFWQLIRTPPDARDPAIVARSTAMSETMAAIIESRLADRPYMAGDAFTAADIAVGTHVHRWLRMPVERAFRPHVERWYARLAERPGSRRVFAVPLT
jgi:glutathione S-transferase